jgi:type I restriction enzyme M protein
MLPGSTLVSTTWSILVSAEESFFNTSQMGLSKLGSKDTKTNLLSYVNAFSRDAREIFEHFRFDEFVTALDQANLLFKVVQKVAATDLHPEVVSNHDMGLVFEELIRKFAESSNETAGEHFTPRDIVRLTTSLVFMEDDDALTQDGIIRTIYDPTAGTGGFLSSGMEYVHELNPKAVMRAFGQELNPESYAICKGDMLIKGQDVSRIKLGNTLSDDQLHGDKFDYMLSNPPFGVDWKKIEGDIQKEHQVKGFDGRFGPGLPRVSDGSLLFLMHLISKMRDFDPNDSARNGSRVGIILNGSPLFTGGAGSGRERDPSSHPRERPARGHRRAAHGHVLQHRHRHLCVGALEQEGPGAQGQGAADQRGAPLPEDAQEPGLQTPGGG